MHRYLAWWSRSISESPYGLKVLGDVVPLKDLFSTLFFVSVGLLLSPQFLLNNLSLVAGFCLVLIVVKVLAGMLAGAIDLLQMPDGSILVSDDFAGCVYRIHYDKYGK